MFVGFSHLEICAEKNSQNVNVTRISEKRKSRSSIGAPASRLRLLLIATWGVYPISYLIPILVKNPSMHQMAYLFDDRSWIYQLGLPTFAYACHSQQPIDYRPWVNFVGFDVLAKN